MYERIDSPPSVVAVKLGESLAAAEIARLYADVGAALGALEPQQRLHYFVDASDWSHLDFDAVFEGVKQRLLHLGWMNRFGRVGIVTDSPFVQGAAGLFGALAPRMELRCFAPAEADAALSWVKGD